jgi:RNA polymerase sigma factor (sigma-70 family)
MNNIAIVGLHEKRLKESGAFNTDNVPQERMRNLHEWLKVAEKTINAFASRSVASQMLRDEDAIAFIAEHLMRGSMRWKEDGGRTLNSYLNQCADWAIKRWILNKKNASKQNIFSLDYLISEDNDLYNYIADKAIPSETSIEHIIDKPYLNDTQKTCLRMKFVDNMTYRAIGTALKKSGARIEQIISRALEKLRSNEQLQNI